jgi:hypothetical protein
MQHVEPERGGLARGPPLRRRSNHSSVGGSDTLEDTLSSGMNAPVVRPVSAARSGSRASGARRCSFGRARARPAGSRPCPRGRPIGRTDPQGQPRPHARCVERMPTRVAATGTKEELAFELSIDDDVLLGPSEAHDAAPNTWKRSCVAATLAPHAHAPCRPSVPDWIRVHLRGTTRLRSSLAVFGRDAAIGSTPRGRSVTPTPQQLARMQVDAVSRPRRAKRRA